MKRIRITLKGLLLAYLFAYWISPNYFSVKVSSLPLMTMQRILVIPVVLWIFFDKKISMAFFQIVKKIPKIILYSFITILVSYFVTSCIAGWNNLFNLIFDVIIPFFVIVYAVYRYFKFEEMQQCIRIILRVLCLLGLFEALTQINVFTFLDTGMTTGLNNGGLLRDTTLRICTAYGHPLAYSMILNIFFPLLCYDNQTKKINLFNDSPTLFLVIFNILLTGSRSGIMFFVIEFVILFLLSSVKFFWKNVFILLLILWFAAILLKIASSISVFESLVRSFLYAVDALLHTNYALAYGGDPSVSNSSEYRSVLWNIMTRDEYFTWFGKGNDYNLNIRIDGWFIESIDNYYINQYLRFGTIGLVSVILIFLSFLMFFGREIFSGARIYMIFVLILVVYMSNLFFVDEIGTLRIAISVLAIGIAFFLKKKDGREL